MATQTDVAVKSLFSDDEYRKINGFQDALDAVAEKNVTPIDASTVIGDGFALLDNKEKRSLVGVPFILLGWKFSKGDHGEFVSAHIVTSRDEKYILNDGSTGVCAQLRAMTNDGINGAVACRNGLRESAYEYTDEKTGEVKPAVTYYIG